MRRIRDLFKKLWELGINGNARLWYIDRPKAVVVMGFAINALIPVVMSLLLTMKYDRGHLSLFNFILLQAVIAYYVAQSLATILRAWLIRRERIHAQGLDLVGAEEFKRQNWEGTYKLLILSAVGFGVIAVADGIVLGADFSVLIFIGVITSVVIMFFDSKRMEWS